MITRSLAAVCAAALIFTLGSPARAKDSQDPPKDGKNRVASLAREYRELRAKRRQLPPGVRLKELDVSGDRLERTLSALGVELGHPPRTTRFVIDCLGEPDAIRDGREMRNYLGIYYRGARNAARPADERRNRKYLIYWWRGWHDFLFFIAEKGVIVDHGWWFAYE